jgi:formylglycine-generating enzyme required for sulfatase activity
LPTEAQWEYACRAGSSTRYCFGDDESGLGEYAWFSANSGNTTHPVGEKKPNAWGLYDMHGNVSEWCADCYDDAYYANSPTDDPTGPATDSFRVLRGGSWGGVAGGCRSAYRYNGGSGARRSFLGLRVSRVVAEAVAETPSPESTATLRIQPVPPQTIEVGKPLSVAVSPESPAQWQGKVRFSLGADAPPGAKIDPQTGAFAWTPPLAEPAGQQEISVSATGPDGQTAQTSFIVTVTRPTPAPVKLPGKEIAIDLGNGVNLEMVLVPAGEFMMGSPDSDSNAQGDEKPRHPVRITKPFYLGKYLVTQEQWGAVMGSNPSSFKAPKNPVETVSWDDCQQFLNRLNGRVGRAERAPPGNRAGEGDFRLPTEAQWEYACRAGSTGKYCFGDSETQLGEYAWYSDNSGGKTHPVGEKKPNAWGLYDMHGNVWEWCQDWYNGGYYAGSPSDDPPGPTTGSRRVLRGGSWSFLARYCRSASRDYFGPGYRDFNLGLRVSRVLAE